MAKRHTFKLAALAQAGAQRRQQLDALLNAMRPRASGGAPKRRGKAGAQFWAWVRVVMENNGCGHPTACRILARRMNQIRVEAERTRDIEKWARENSKWGTWKPESLAREYRAADKRHKDDQAFRDECNLWLPIFREAADWLKTPQPAPLLRRMPPALIAAGTKQQRRKT